MRTGRVEANLVRLNENARLSLTFDDLIAQAGGAGGMSVLDNSDVVSTEGSMSGFRASWSRLIPSVVCSMHRLPGPALNDLLVRLRLRTFERLQT